VKVVVVFDRQVSNRRRVSEEDRKPVSVQLEIHMDGWTEVVGSAEEQNTPKVPAYQTRTESYGERITFETNSRTAVEIHSLLYNTMRRHPSGPQIFQKSRSRVPSSRRQKVDAKIVLY
jgi:hypothetical protein